MMNDQVNSHNGFAMMDDSTINIISVIIIILIHLISQLRLSVRVPCPYVIVGCGEN